MSGFFGAAQAASKRTGEVWELSYLPDPMWPGCAVADHRIASQTDPRYKRLFSKIGQTFRLAGDTYDTSTHFRFPDGTGFRKGATVSAPVLAPATYPLVITNGQAIAVGFTGNLPTPASQTARYTVQGALPASVNHLSTTDVAAPQTFTVAAASPVVEFEITSADVVGVGGIDFSCGVSDAATTANVAKFIISAAGGTHQIVVMVGNVIVSAPAAIAPGINVAGFEFNTAAGTLKAKINGAYVALGSDVYTPTAAAIVAITAFENAGTSAGNAGLIFEATARTESTTIAQTYGAAANDIGGNLLTGGATTCDVGTRTGSATTGGHALTIAEMPAHDHDYTELVGGGATAGDGAANDGNPDQYQTRQTSQTGEGAAHSHSLDPLACKFVVLVKL